MDQEVYPVIIDPPAANSAASADPVQTRTYIASVVWLVGAGLLLLYALIGYLRLQVTL